MKPEKAQEMQWHANLTEYSLEHVVLQIGPSWVYEVAVSKDDVIDAKNLLRRLCAQYVGNPFSPYFNLRVEPGFQCDEWSVSADGKTIWSSGA